MPGWMTASRKISGAAAANVSSTARIAGLRDRLLAGLRGAIPGITINGSWERRIPGNLNITFPAARAGALMQAMPELCVSTGSACSSAAVEPSYVLRALGLSDEAAGRTLRVGIGRFTSAAEIDAACALFAAAYANLTEA